MDISSDIKSVLDEYNIVSTPKICAFLSKFIEIMLEYNEKINITAITEKDDIIYKHLLDSIWICSKFRDNSKIIDIGCGGGFPSIPLKIIKDNLNITAIDSNNKKINFVNLAISELNLAGIEAIHTRIEDIAHGKTRESYDYAISRAVAPLPTIIEYSAPLVKIGGYVVAYKGSNYEEELSISTNAMQKLGCAVENIEKIYIKELDTYRYVLFIKKLHKTDSKYPRSQNKPRLQPL